MSCDSTKPKMTLVEFAKKIVGLNLYPFQKTFLEALEKAPPNTRLVSIPSRGIFFVTKEGDDVQADADRQGKR